MKIPQRYKHTEFGLIPDDWVLCTFKDVFISVPLKWDELNN